MLIFITMAVLLILTAVGYYFAGKQGAIGTFLILFFFFGLPAIIYSVQTS